MEVLARDLRFAVRAVRTRPILSTVAMLSLGLGIGATATLFALTDAVLLRPLAVHQPERLLRLYQGEAAAPHGNWLYADLLEAQRLAAGTFESWAATAAWQFALGAQTGSRLVDDQLVSPSYFEVVGLRPALGRGFTPADPRRAASTAAAEVVLGHGLWQRQFGGEASVVGETISLGGRAFEVVGVAPPGFRGLQLDEPAELWVPLGNYARLATGFFARFDAISAARDGARISMWDALVRLAPGVPAGSVEARMATAADALAALDGEAAGSRRIVGEPASLGAVPVGERDVTRRFLVILGAAVAALLAIAGLNVGSLLLARAADRRRETLVRLALGCSRRRLLRQMVTESALIAAGGTVLGLLGAWWALDLLAAYRLPGGISVAALGLDLSPAVVLAAVAVSALMAIACGMVPALRATRSALADSLRTRAGDGGPSRRRLLDAFLAAQVALSLMLLVSAGLFVRSVASAFATDLGFASERLAGLTVDAGMARLSPIEALAYYDQLLEHVDAQPATERAALSSGGFGQAGFSMLGVQVEGHGFDAGAHVGRVFVSPGFFDTLGIGHITGRDFRSTDGASAPPVAVINRGLANRLWPSQNALGRRFHYDDDPGGSPWIEVVGVVADSRLWNLRQADQGFVFRPFAQEPDASTQGEVSLFVRGRGRAPDAASLIAATAAIHPAVPVVDVWTIRQRIASVLLPERLGRTVLGLFSAVALALAAIGLAAVVAHGVVRRRREIGVRMTLGARSHGIVLSFVRRNLTPTLIGILVGAAGSAVAARALGAFLYAVRPLDPLSFATATVLLLTVAAVASLLPARAAARVDPMDVLRHE